jgi:hypothetical protein
LTPTGPGTVHGPGGTRGRADAGRLRLPAAAALLAGLLLAAFPAFSGSLLVRRSGEGSLAALADLVALEVGKKPGAGAPAVVELTGDPIADAAAVARRKKGTTVVYAVGADAAALAADVDGASVIALGIANPAKVATSATYLSVYPRLERVFAFLQEKLGARRVGFLHTPTQNGEMALVFAKAAQARGVGFEPIAVSSPGDLARAMRESLPRIDVLLLAVDPLLFDRRALDVVVQQTLAQKKPAVGFLGELAPLGVAVCLVTAPADVAARAVELAEFTGVKGKKRVEVDSTVIILSKKAVEPLGLDRVRLGADDVR